MLEAVARNWLLLSRPVELVIVPRRRQHMKRPFRLPLQIGVELVVRLRNFGLQPTRGGMPRVFHGNRKIVPRRVMPEVRTPVAAAQFFVLRPPVEGREREMVQDEPLPTGDI